jgi:hypothetical protein
MDTSSLNTSMARPAKGMFGPTSDIHESIRQLFDLPSEYLLQSDFDCVYREKNKMLPTSGHLYIFNKCVCFHSPKMRPIVIHFTQVTGIKNAEKMTDKVRNKLSFLVEGGGHYNFKRVKNRDQVYELVQKLLQDSKRDTSLSSISPAHVPESPFATDSVLKTVDGSNDSPDESGDEEVKEDDAEPVAVNEEDYTNLREPTDDELWQAMSKYPLLPNHKEMGKTIMPFGAEEYWDMFHAPEAHYTFDKFFQYRGFKKIEVVLPWTDKIEDPNFQKGFEGRKTS